MTVNAVTSQVTPKIEENSQIRTRTTAAGFDVLLARLGAADAAARDVSAQAVRSEPARRPAERALDIRIRATTNALEPRESRDHDDKAPARADNTPASGKSDQHEDGRGRDVPEHTDDHAVDRPEHRTREHDRVKDKAPLEDESVVPETQEIEGQAAPPAKTKQAKSEHADDQTQESDDVPVEESATTQAASRPAETDSKTPSVTTAVQAAAPLPVTVKPDVVEAASVDPTDATGEAQTSKTPMVAKLAAEQEQAELKQTGSSSSKKFESDEQPHAGTAQVATPVSSAAAANVAEGAGDAVDSDVSPVNAAASSRAGSNASSTAGAPQSASQSQVVENGVNAPAPAQLKQTLEAFEAVRAEQAPQAEEQTPENANVGRVARGLHGAINQQGGSVTLRLAPPEIGFVRIDMDVKGGVAQVRLQAENESSTALLTRHLSTLKNAIESHGLTVERLDVRTLDASPRFAFSQERSDLAFGDGRSRGQFSEQRGGSTPQADTPLGAREDDTSDFQQAMVDAVG